MDWHILILQSPQIGVPSTQIGVPSPHTGVPSPQIGVPSPHTGGSSRMGTNKTEHKLTQK